MKKTATAERFLRNKAFPSGITDEKWNEFKTMHSGTNWVDFAINAMSEYLASLPGAHIEGNKNIK